MNPIHDHNMSQLNPIIWKDHLLFLLDQRDLPLQENFLPIHSIEECFAAIKDMIVRGAPCIGFTAIYGLALWAKNHPLSSLNEFLAAGSYLKLARPTAVNLEFEINRCFKMAEELDRLGQLKLLYENLVAFAHEQIARSNENNLMMAKLAAQELSGIYGDRPLRLMTHCNTGTLACGSLGTALGVICHLHTLNRVEKVWVDETRPYMQGTRLTSYELNKLGISHFVVVEGAASYLMREKLVDAIFVGADRIALNGDTANKIGTSTLAIVAQYYQIPFYVVAPTSSCDLSINSGEEIKIELRDPKEILEVGGIRLAANQIQSLNPSFDITSKDLITGIICEKGIIKPQVNENLAKLF